MSICFKCEKKEVCLIKGIKESCSDIEVVSSGPSLIMRGGRSSGKSLQLIEKMVKMLEESHANADRMFKLMDEMELQHDKLIIENESLKHLVSKNNNIRVEIQKRMESLVFESNDYNSRVVSKSQYDSDKAYRDYIDLKLSSDKKNIEFLKNILSLYSQDGK